MSSRSQVLSTPLSCLEQALPQVRSEAATPVLGLFTNTSRRKTDHVFLGRSLTVDLPGKIQDAQLNLLIG